MTIRNQDMVGPASVKIRRRTNLKIKPSTVAVYASVFALVIAIISIGYNQPQSSSIIANAANVDSANISDQLSVDNAVAVGVAAGVAQVNNLPVATSVSNLAISTQTIVSIAQSDSLVLSKPQIIESITESRLVISHVVLEGDNANTLAEKYGISAQTIKWANNLTTDWLSVGSSIKILPFNGVLYNVKQGDTIDSISEKYSVDKTRLVLKNDLDLDVSGLKPNTSIILPDGILPTEERPGYIAPVTYYTFVSNGNAYAPGNCTWYVYQRRAELGIPVSSSLGNANTWALRSPTGYDHKPIPGAVLVDDGGWLGHVAVVESVDSVGNITISEMNNYAYGGWNIVSKRNISAGQAELYKYIH